MSWPFGSLTALSAGLLPTQNQSLRSFFPREIVDEILSYLDRPSFLSLCSVSFGSLEEAGPLLYREVEIKSKAGYLSCFRYDNPLPPSSRLAPSLSIPSYTKTISLRAFTMVTPGNETYDPPTTIPPPPPSRLLLPPSGSAQPPLPLTHLYFTRPSGGHDDPTLNFLSDYLLPHLNPQTVHLWADDTHEFSSRHNGATRRPDSSSFLSSWTSLEQLNMIGWFPFYDWPTERPFFLLDSPLEKEEDGEGRRVVRMELDCRGFDWVDTIQFARWFREGGILGLKCLGKGGLKWTIKEEDEKVLKHTLAREILDDEEREKVEFVVVQ